MARPRSTSSEAIIDVAAQLFLERGFHNTSIDDVAEAVGITKPTVYSYVKSKQWLLDQIILRVITDLSAILEPWAPSDERALTDQLDDYLDYHIDRATSLRVFFRILYSEETEMSLQTRERWHEFAQQVTDHFVELLAAYRDDGRFLVEVDQHALANLFIPTLVTLHRWYNPDGQVNPHQIRELTKQLLRGVIDL